MDNKELEVSNQKLDQANFEGVSPLIKIAMQPGFDTGKLAEMMKLQQQWEQAEAKKAYHRALAAFKSKAPKIEKTKEVKFSGKGGNVAYWHADLADAMEKVNPVLSESGLSLNWKTDQENGQIKVTAILTHEQGYSESTSLSAPPDQSGGKNQIQAICSTVSYLERYTAFSLLGLASSDQDNDGSKFAQKEFITEDQLGTIRDLIEDTGAHDTVALAKTICDQYGVESLAELQSGYFKPIVNRLKLTAKKNKEQT